MAAVQIFYDFIADKTRYNKNNVQSQTEFKSNTKGLLDTQIEFSCYS